MLLSKMLYQSRVGNTPSNAFIRVQIERFIYRGSWYGLERLREWDRWRRWTQWTRWTVIARLTTLGGAPRIDSWHWMVSPFAVHTSLRGFIESGSNISLIHVWWSFIQLFFHLTPGSLALNREIRHELKGERKVTLSHDTVLARAFRDDHVQTTK